MSTRSLSIVSTTSAASFQCRVLSEEEKTTLKNAAKQTAQELLACAILEGGPVHWKVHGTEENLQVFDGIDSATGERIWCAKSQLQAFLDEVHLMTYTSTTEEFKAYSQQFIPNVIDGARLYTIKEPSEKHPYDFVGVNWLLQKSPSKGLLRNRDWCFVEGQFETKFNGRRAFVRAFKSITMGSCPDLQAEYGYQRGKFTRYGYIFVETNRPGYLDVFQLDQSYVKGDSKAKFTDWLSSSSSKYSRFRKLMEMQVALRKYRLSKAKFLPLSQLVPPARRNSCNVCSLEFDKSAKKLNCRVCAEVVCRECSKIYQVKIKEDQWAELRVCDPCVFGEEESACRRNLVSTSSQSQRSSVSVRSSGDCSSLRHANDSGTVDELDDELLCMAGRDTLVSDCRSSQPMYKPAITEKFNIASFFAAPPSSNAEQMKCS